jgi:membrane-associated phospholipid phosphatase
MLQWSRVNHRRLAIVAAWLALFALALCADRPVAAFLHNSPLQIALTKTHWHYLVRVIRLLGNFATFTLVVSVILFFVGWMRVEMRWWTSAAFVFLSGALAAVNTLIKWIVGRARPFQGEVFAFHPFVGGWHGLGGPNQSFPSGDVCLGAATAAALMILFPRWRWLWWMLILLIAAERIAEGAHYVSDTVAAAGLGFLLARISWRLLGLRRVERGCAPRLDEARRSQAGPLNAKQN